MSVVKFKSFLDFKEFYNAHPNAVYGCDNHTLIDRWTSNSGPKNYTLLCCEGDNEDDRDRGDMFFVDTVYRDMLLFDDLFGFAYIDFDMKTYLVDDEIVDNLYVVTDDIDCWIEVDKSEVEDYDECDILRYPIDPSGHDTWRTIYASKTATAMAFDSQKRLDEAVKSIAANAYLIRCISDDCLVNLREQIGFDFVEAVDKIQFEDVVSIRDVVEDMNAMPGVADRGEDGSARRLQVPHVKNDDMTDMYIGDVVEYGLIADDKYALVLSTLDKRRLFSFYKSVSADKAVGAFYCDFTPNNVEALKVSAKTGRAQTPLDQIPENYDEMSCVRASIDRAISVYNALYDAGIAEDYNNR